VSAAIRHRAAWRASRERALIAAIAVISARGVEGTRFVDVAAAGGMSVGNLQYLFGSRAGMIGAALESSAITDLGALTALAAEGELPAGLSVSLADTVDGLGHGVATRTELWHAALRDERLAPLATAVAEAWRQVLRRYLTAAELESTLVLAGVSAPPGLRHREPSLPPSR
jgi:AcrR family transcriptional regulator